MHFGEGPRSLQPSVPPFGMQTQETFVDLQKATQSEQLPLFHIQEPHNNFFLMVQHTSKREVNASSFCTSSFGQTVFVRLIGGVGNDAQIIVLKLELPRRLRRR